MRLDINLASQPYEDARQFWLRWGSGVGAAGLFTLILLTLTITGWFNARRDHAAMREKARMMPIATAIRSSAEEFLNRRRIEALADQAEFLNELIERKAFSWIARAGKFWKRVMPPRVHLGVSIHPELDEDNQLALKMDGGRRSRDRAIELAGRMEDRGDSRRPISSGSLTTIETGGDTLQFGH